VIHEVLFAIGFMMVMASAIGIKLSPKEQEENPTTCCPARDMINLPQSAEPFREKQEIHYHFYLLPQGEEKHHEQPETIDGVLQHMGEKFRLLTQGDQEVQGGYWDKAHSTDHHGAEIYHALKPSPTRNNRNP
jgi:hypothetical protein